MGVEEVSGKQSGPITPGSGDLEDSLGMTFGALYAMRARRYMETYGLTSEQLVRITVINRKNAYYHAKSSFGELISIEEVLNSPMVNTPLHFVPLFIFIYPSGVEVLDLWNEVGVLQI